jgi:peptide/nickel transport system substrate-binding protein
LKAIPNYWGKTKPHFTYIDIEQTPDPTSAMTDLETGSLDIEWNLPYQLTATVNHIPGLQLVNPEVPGGWDLLEYDDYLPPFNNLKVRKALAYATDRATMLATAFAGQGTVATGDVPFPPGLADVTPATQPYPYSYNLAKAKALFAAAGVKTLTIWNTPSVPGFTEIGLVLQADLAKIGVTLKITSAASATTWYERFGPPPTKKWPGYFVPGGYVSHPDAGAILSQWTPYLCNCDYDNPAFTKDVQAGLATNNVAAETTAFDAAVKIFEQFLPVDIIAWIPTQLTDSKTISGAFMQGDGFPRLDDAVRTNG